jgi:hypothetical protein
MILDGGRWRRVIGAFDGQLKILSKRIHDVGDARMMVEHAAERVVRDAGTVAQDAAGIRAVVKRPPIRVVVKQLFARRGSVR